MSCRAKAKYKYVYVTRQSFVRNSEPKEGIKYDI